MNLPLAYHADVRGDIDESYAWYENQRQELGHEFLTALQACMNQVQESPLSRAIVYREIRAALVKRFPYVVYYRVESSRVMVVAVQHGRRSSRRWRQRAV